MRKILTRKSVKIMLLLMAIGALSILGVQNYYLDASSHREAPMILNDPLADNTDVYAFRDPDDRENVMIIANYIPFELPFGGPNYYTFGENILYEIHIKNNPATEGDDIIYQFEFDSKNEDPTTFFNVRLGKENLSTTYVCRRSMDGGKSFTTILARGLVPQNNIGPRSYGPVGSNSEYRMHWIGGISTVATGERIFAGPVDDPFFVDLGGIFDLGNVRPENAVDGLKRKNVHSIALSIPIKTLQKDGKDVDEAKNILDSDYIIGVWASASRKKMRVLNGDGTESHSGEWVQISRLGMPLTNEVVIPIGQKDYWNSIKPYNEDKNLEKYFTNPELALYMDDDLFGTAVPGLAQLRIQRNSLQSFDFGNGNDGLAGLLGNEATKGTAFDKALFGDYLLRKGQPRSVDILPIFMTGVPNLPPYQLATGKEGNPLAVGKPFINNFLPTFGDMLRLNMAVPTTLRTNPEFSSLGLLQAAVLGLTDSRFNTSTKLQYIPNMDGFPNGRRLEDDVTRIELQAVGGVVLAAVGLWYDDYKAGDPNPVTTDLVDVLSFTTGVEANDTTFRNKFPFMQMPWDGFNTFPGESAPTAAMKVNALDNEKQTLRMTAPEATMVMSTFPNPAVEYTTFKYRVGKASSVSLKIYDEKGSLVANPVKDEMKQPGIYEVSVDVRTLKKGMHIAKLNTDSEDAETIKFVVQK